MSVGNLDIRMISKEALAVLDWRDFAALGLWKRIYLERLIIDARDSDDYSELHALLDCLTKVVPIIPGPFAGEGPLSPPRRSTLHDSAFPQMPHENSRHAYLSRYIDQGGYDQAIKTVAEILDRQHLRLDSKFAKDLNREEQLAHAVALFEQIEGIVDPSIWGPPNDSLLIFTQN